MDFAGHRPAAQSHRLTHRPQAGCVGIVSLRRPLPVPSTIGENTNTAVQKPSTKQVTDLIPYTSISPASTLISLAVIALIPWWWWW
jgi:hypothetical protein